VKYQVLLIMIVISSVYVPEWIHFQTDVVSVLVLGY